MMPVVLGVCYLDDPTFVVVQGELSFVYLPSFS